MSTDVTPSDDGSLATTPKRGTLTVERAQALLDRVLQRRIRLVDRYNGLSIPGVREPNPHPKAWDGKVCPGDPPGIQMIFHLGKMLKEANDIEDPYNRINAQAGITKQLAALCDRFEDQNSKIVSEVQKFIEMERNKGDLSDAELAKLAQVTD